MACKGHKDFAGVPQEPSSSGGMWYPRVAPQHGLPGATEFLEGILPLLGGGLRLVEEVPDCASHIHANQRAVGDLAFFHFSVLKYDANGRPMLRPAKPEHEKACCNMHRLSAVLAAGSQARAELLMEVNDLDSSKAEKVIMQHKRTIFHQDLRDLGGGSELLGHVAAEAAGIHVVKGCKSGEELMQWVHVFSFGCSQFEALSAVGLSEDEVSFTLQGPAVETSEGVRYMIVGMDFSVRLHANPQLETEAPLPPRAWAIGVTAYSTVHGVAYHVERARPSY